MVNADVYRPLRLPLSSPCQHSPSNTQSSGFLPFLLSLPYPLHLLSGVTSQINHNILVSGGAPRKAQPNTPLFLRVIFLPHRHPGSGRTAQPAPLSFALTHRQCPGATVPAAPGPAGGRVPRPLSAAERKEASLGGSASWLISGTSLSSSEPRFPHPLLQGS